MDTPHPNLPAIKLPEHLSVSQVRTLLNCGWRWAYEHSDAERGIDVGWSARLRGSCLDAAVTEHFRRKAADGVGITLARMKEIAEHEHRLHEDVTNFDIPVIKSRDRSVVQAGVYWEFFGQHFTPRSVEDVQREYTHRDDDLIVPIKGIVDLIADTPLVVDTKVRGKVPKEAVVHRDMQLTTYAMMTGVNAVALAIITDDNYPRAEFIASVRSKAQIDALRLMYNSAWDMITKAAFLPAQEGHYLCHPRWCPHWQRCPMGAAADLDLLTIPGMDE